MKLTRVASCLARYTENTNVFGIQQTDEKKNTKTAECALHSAKGNVVFLKFLKRKTSK